MLILKPLSPKRLDHSVSVAKLCFELAKTYDIDAMKAYLCGVCHDMARELPVDEMVAIAREHGVTVDDFEEREPLLLHGALAAVAMAENYGIDDEEMLNAVRRHTVGAETMTLLDKIVFIADKTEPLRSYAGVEQLRALAFTDIDAALSRAVEGEIRYCEAKGYRVHPTTIALNARLARDRQ